MAPGNGWDIARKEVDYRHAHTKREIHININIYRYIHTYIYIHIYTYIYILRIECKLRTIVQYHIIQHSKIHGQKGTTIALLAQDPLQRQNKELPCRSRHPRDVIAEVSTSQPSTRT